MVRAGAVRVGAGARVVCVVVGRWVAVRVARGRGDVVACGAVGDGARVGADVAAAVGGGGVVVSLPALEVGAAHPVRMAAEARTRAHGPECNDDGTETVDVDLIEFLRARLNEDEAAAQAATSGNWRYNPRKQWHSPPSVLGVIPEGEEYVATGRHSAPSCVAVTGPADHPQSMADAAHIARWDPTRIAAEVEAKRRVIEVLELAGDSTFPADAWVLAREALRELAQPYRDHPEFDPSWLASEAFQQRWVMGAP